MFMLFTIEGLLKNDYTVELLLYMIPVGLMVLLIVLLLILNKRKQRAHQSEKTSDTIPPEKEE